jgi:hypothetical protein
MVAAAIEASLFLTATIIAAIAGHGGIRKDLKLLQLWNCNRSNISSYSRACQQHNNIEARLGIGAARIIAASKAG